MPNTRSKNDASQKVNPQALNGMAQVKTHLMKWVHIYRLLHSGNP